MTALLTAILVVVGALLAVLHMVPGKDTPLPRPDRSCWSPGEVTAYRYLLKNDAEAARYFPRRARLPAAAAS